MATPVLHYFDLGSLGRGEVVRLFLREIGVEFEDKRYSYNETWAATDKSLGLTLTGKLPLLEIDGHKLSQHVPILRYLSRRAGGFDGETGYEKYLVDAVADIYIDWRAAWVANLTAKSNDYKNKTVPNYYAIFSDFYSRNTSGPYLLGDQPTYADFAVFQALDNDAVTGNAPSVLPEPLSKLKGAMLTRPKIKQYLSQRG
ncbi:hypothetical protein GQ53DRAFT_687416 [Thozetella sp. PMI_491]|nr:hypothetical protein GQ53DRAFT_687416 [Thozetella sp. PMI_491]